MSEERNALPVDRRRLLRRAGTVAAGIAGTGVVGAVAAVPAQAAPGDPVLQGRDNNAEQATTLRSSSATAATLRLANSNTTLDPEGQVVAGPVLQLAPSGQGISSQAEFGSLGMDANGTIWAITGEIGDFKFRDYLRTNVNSNMIVPIAPQRVIDTRSADLRTRIVNPAGNLDTSGRLLAGRTIHINLEEFVFIGEALFGNVTVVGPLANGFIQIFPYGIQRPAVSTINFHTNQTLSNSFMSGIGYVVDYISLYASRTTHVIVDVVAFVVGAGQVNPAILPGDPDLVAESATDRRAAAAKRPKPSWAK